MGRFHNPVASVLLNFPKNRAKFPTPSNSCKRVERPLCGRSGYLQIFILEKFFRAKIERVFLQIASR